MQIFLDRILFSAEDRSREDYGDVQELIQSIIQFGQLQPVVIRPVDPEEGDEADQKAIEEDKDFVLVDGGRRFLALEACWRKDMDVPDLDERTIDCRLADSVDSTEGLVLEYKINEERKDFDWREKARHVRKLHDRLMEAREDWNARLTGEKIGVSKATVSKYLSLTENEEVFNHPEVKGADSWRTAVKKAKIVRDQQRREKVNEHRDRLEELKKETDMAPVSEDDVDELREGVGAETSDEVEERMSEKDRDPDVGDLVTNDDCLHWFSEFPDGHFDWVHWDPPYGGGQAGGAFGSHKDINDDWESASRLMREGIPEVHRILRPGHWLAIWCHPARINWLSRYLRGHQRNTDTNQCRHCGTPWEPGKLSEPCESNPDWHFWVNPYPNIWHKFDRKADGHDIERYQLNQYETFLLAGKLNEDGSLPILPDSSAANVHRVATVDSDDRRHVMHKPAALIRRIISIISVEGSLGADPSAGSGSVIPAALKEGRKVHVCEQDEDYANVCREVAQETVKEMINLAGIN